MSKLFEESVTCHLYALQSHKKHFACDLVSVGTYKVICLNKNSPNNCSSHFFSFLSKASMILNLSEIHQKQV